MVSSLSRIEEMIVGKSENERPVAPGPPENRVSPVNRTPASGRYRQIDPGECPGVWITRSSVPATAIRCSSVAGQNFSFGWLCRHSSSSPGCSRTGA
jgi:hypothetical protein